jgi:hypothetical protein
MVVSAALKLGGGVRELGSTPAGTTWCLSCHWSTVMLHSTRYRWHQVMDAKHYLCKDLSHKALNNSPVPGNGK